MLKEVRIPEISENVTSGKVVKVLVKVGDWIEIDDILMEFETEKALVEIPSTQKGKIVELLARENEVMNVGDVIARVETDAEEEAGPPETASKVAPEAGAPAPAEPEDETEDQTPAQEAEQPRPSAEERASAEKKAGREVSVGKAAAQFLEAETRPPAPAAPSVRRFARELGLDIHRISGTGPGGRIRQEDVKTAARQGLAALPLAGPSALAEVPLPDFSHWGPVDMVELSTVRRLTARGMAHSWQQIPHVTQFDRTDLNHVEEFLRRNKADFQRRGVKLTLTAVVMKICAAALLKFPNFNCSIDMAGDRLIFKKYVHIGLAVDTERGLLVPVVRNADRKGIFQLAREIADLAERARTKKIKPDEMEGGTFTISNQGGIGGTQFTPIIVWPQAALLGISRTRIEPVLVDGAFVPHPMLPLALSYDHRIIDGADAARFLRWICESLEQPLNLHLD
ncbi:MAG: 2-oxo acid dehydrogenase subunit E2 [Desulfobacteraceae bacterium]|nr:2-oxo acid dehydrogenase subunit E2 [Desulfobacteraceae bacterium]